MTGEGKGRKKGTNIFYVFHNGQPLIFGFGDLIEKWSLPDPFTPGENTSPWTLMQNSNQLCTWEVLRISHTISFLKWVSVKEHGNGEYLFFTESLSLLKIDLRHHGYLYSLY